MRKTFTLLLVLAVITVSAKAEQIIHKADALTFTSAANITDPVIKLVDKNWTAAQFKALALATKSNTMLQKVDMSEITFVSNNTLNASMLFEGCANLKTIIWFKAPVRLSNHVFTKAFKDCSSLEGTIDLTAFPQFGTCSYMFLNCPKINEIKFSPYATIPTKATYMFKGTNPNLTVYIPETAQWDSLANAYPTVKFIKIKK